ncbi:hypothetical protein Ga0466249_001303 [Sporomusaceae bacterium BoRhaA]|uniref:hypothetical protein n=1 Tax=Pelorhabdus rhamnosifermentans TaxID=2772457 RepID=UPI001C064804|nr:hypothetical protein [Pelorhabdus rhamnosifermentans]MBU2700211.1 hypothetical protein [Pelorhabdus rhamnosifermentans]
MSSDWLSEFLRNKHSSNLLCNEKAKELLCKARKMLCNKNFWEACRQLTFKTLKDKFDINQINDLLKHMPYSDGVLTCINGMPSGIIGAAATIECTPFTLSEILCAPFDQPWYFKEESYCPLVGEGGTIGGIYNVVDWDVFFRDTAQYFAAGGGYEGGLIQITWMKSDGYPTGQYNGVGEGHGACSFGGTCHWRSK